MKKIIFVLVYSIAVLSVFSYGKVSENEDLSNLLNGQYAKTMSDASEKLEELDVAVKKTLLFNELDGSKEARDDIWRLSSDIKDSVSSLPLDRSFSNEWINYLGRLGNYSKDSERVDDQKEYHRAMTQASGNLRIMADQWQVATADMLQGQMSVDAWSNQLESIDAAHDWAGMGNSVKKYTESDFPLTASESDSMKKKDLQTMDDKNVTREEAIIKFKELFPNTSNSSVVVENSKPGSPYPFYHIRFAENQTIGYIDITEKGGHVLSYLAERSFGKENLPFQLIKDNAEEFLKDSGYGDLVYEEARENNTAWHFVFVRIEPEYKAKVFSDAIHLKVAKDTGGIIGLNAMEYIRKETTEKQKIVKKDWNSFFHSNVKVVKDELAYVENDRLEQRLSHFLTVTMDVDNQIETYVVVVDTETSEIIKTEQQ